MPAHGKDYWDHIVPLSLQTNGCFCFVPILIFIFLFHPVFTLSLSLSLFFFLFSFSFPLFLSFCLLFFSLSFVARLDSFYTTYSECVSWPSLKDLTKPNNTTTPPPAGAPVPFFFLLSFPCWVCLCGKKLLPYLGLPCCKLSCDIALVPNAKNKIKTKIQFREESIVGLYHLAPNVLVKFLVFV